MELSQLIDDVRPDAMTAPNLVLLDAVQKAAAEFFSLSTVWRETLDPIQLVIGQATYDIPVPTGARALWIVEDGLRLDTGPLRIASQSDLFHLGTSLTGRPTHGGIDDSTDEFRVWRVPAIAADVGVVLMLVALTSTREATDIPDTQAERWRDGIVAGAKARVLRSPGRPWSNPQLSAFHLTEFNHEVARARRQATTESYARPQRVANRRW